MTTSWRKTSLRARWLGTTLGIATALALALALAPFVAAASASGRDPRADADRAARAEIRELHLFRGGYGMHISPGPIDLAGVAEKLTRAMGIDNRVAGLFNVDYEGANAGHEFSQDFAEADRDDLIEYLKTL